MAEAVVEETKDPKSGADILKMPGQDHVKFGVLIGLVKVGEISNKEVVDTVLHLLVGGEFDMETNFIIADPENVLHMQELMDCCNDTLQAELWSVFTAILRKSTRNLQACLEVGLIEHALGRLQKADEIIADLLIEMMGVLASYSITVKELKIIFAMLKGNNNKWRHHSVKLLSVLKQMPERHGPDEFFSFPGKKGSGIALPPIARWPYQNGWSFSTWFRLDPVTGVNIEREKPYLYCFKTSKGIGYSCHFLGNALVVTSMKVKGKGFQHCVKFDIQPRKWYMVTIVHVYNRWSKSEIRAYVNGEMVSSTDMTWLVNTNDPFDKCFFGSTPEMDMDNSFCGQMSTTYGFTEALSSQHIAAMYQLGADYKGQFKFDNECTAKLSPTSRSLVYDGKLTSAIMFMYNPIACDGQLSLESSPKGNQSFFVHTPHALMQQEVKAIVTHSIHSTLHSIGGVQTLFPLFSQLDHYQELQDGSQGKVDYTICATLMTLICDLLESSVTIQQQFLQAKGFLVISDMLEKASQEHISLSVLDVFLRLTKYLTNLPAGTPLLRQMFDHVLFNPALWIHSPVEVQTKLYAFLATEFVNDAHIFNNIRRVSSVLQTIHTLKYYYWVVNPKDRSGILPKGTDGPRPDKKSILELRGHMLMYLRNLILKGAGILDDELQSILNFLTTLHEDDNIEDVLQLTVSLMAEHPASMVPSFDRKGGVRTVFKLLASANEGIRLQSLKLLGFFLMRSTHMRKGDAMQHHNLFSLIAERLMLNADTFPMQTYNGLFELLTEKMNREIQYSQHSEPDSNLKMENPLVLKVIAQLIKQSKQSEELQNVKKVFLSDLTILCNHNRDNRRTVLQMSVWQDWLFSLAYIYPRNQDEFRITEMVMSLFRMLLHHAMKLEYGGWRVWIDTLAILHSKVAYEDFKIRVSNMYHQYEQQRVDHLDPEERATRPISTISGVFEEQPQPPVAKSTATITEITESSDSSIQAETPSEQNGEVAPSSEQVEQTSSGTEETPVKEEEPLNKEEIQNGHEENPSATVKQEETNAQESSQEGTVVENGTDDSHNQEDKSEAYEKLGLAPGTVEFLNEVTENVAIKAEKDNMEETSKHKIDHIDPEGGSIVNGTAELSESEPVEKAEDNKDECDKTKEETDSNDATGPIEENTESVSSVSESQDSSAVDSEPVAAASSDSKEPAAIASNQSKGPSQENQLTNENTASSSNVSPHTKPTNLHINEQRSPDVGQRIYSPGPRAPPFRIPEFSWSFLHQKLLSDLLFALETDIQVWKTHSTKTVIDFVNASENHIFVVNVTHMISQLTDSLITACGGLLPLLAAATSPNGEVEILEPSQGLSVEQAVSFMQRIMYMADILIFASSTNFSELEHEKNMSSGGILRQCLRLVATTTVRNCLECRHRQQGRSPPTTPTPGTPRNGEQTPLNELIKGAQPSRENLVEHLGSQNSPIKDAERLLQDMDINRLRAVVYRDVEETKQAQFLALAIVYFVSVLMVSKYRDILEPSRSQPSTPARSRSTSAIETQGTTDNIPERETGSSEGQEDSLASDTKETDSKSDEPGASGDAKESPSEKADDIETVPSSEQAERDVNQSTPVPEPSQAESSTPLEQKTDSPDKIEESESSKNEENKTENADGPKPDTDSDTKESSEQKAQDLSVGDGDKGSEGTKAESVEEDVKEETTKEEEKIGIENGDGDHAKEKPIAQEPEPTSPATIDVNVNIGGATIDESTDDTPQNNSAIIEPVKTEMVNGMDTEKVQNGTDETDSKQDGGISSIAVTQGSTLGDNQERPTSLDLSQSHIPSPVRNLPNPEVKSVANLTDRLEKCLGSAAPLLREIFTDFAPFLSKTLLGSHGQELLLSGTGMMTLKQSTSTIELVMLLCSQEWQNSLQKHAGLAFIELVNEGRLLSHATRDHIVRVANEAEFILNRMRAEDVQKHADFESVCATTQLERREEEKVCDHLITSARRRDHVVASKLLDRVINLLTNKHGAWGEHDQKRNEFWKLDTWEDDSRRKRRFIHNPVGSSHPEATLKAAIEHGATEDAINQAREAFHAHVASMKKSRQQEDEDDNSLLDERELDQEFVGPVAVSTKCKLLAPGVAVNGQMSITKTELYFEMDEDDPENKKIDQNVLQYVDALHGKWHFNEIRAIFARKYLLQATAIEVFMASRTAVMFAFPDHATVKKVVNGLPRVGVGVKYGLPQARRTSLASPKQLFKQSGMMQKWQRREISNFDYIMYLNTVAGRSYNDLNQYPVFPWVIVNYESAELDLSLPSNFRDLSKPIGALNPSRKAFFDERYTSWENDTIPPFHYGTHYSTSAFTLNWLLRIEPFTSMFLNLQGGKFDHADRTFHSIAQSWKNCQRDTSDVKELIPEFFYLPDMFVNNNSYKLGKMDDGVSVDNVELPPWAKTPEDFVRINRMALETEFISCQLHHWIDLIFGYKQKGPEAVRATNVFYYLTYEGSVDLEKMTDPVMKAAIENQIRCFGQTPSQLLTEPHPPRSSAMHVSPMMFTGQQDDVCMIMKFLSNSPVCHLSCNTHPAVPSPSVTAITCNHNFSINKWNQNTGASTPAPSYENKSENTPQLPLSMDQLLVYGTGLHRRNLGNNFDERFKFRHTSFLTTADNRNIMACGFWDKSFRIFATDSAKFVQIVYGHFDLVTCLARSECNVNQDCYVVTGSRDCTAMVWHWNSKAGAILGDNGSVENPTPKATLTGHQEEVTCIVVSAELGIVISGSYNGPILVHTTTGELLRSLDAPDNFRSPKLITMNREGYIVANYEKGNVCLFGLTGKLLRSMEHNDNVLCTAMSRDGQYLMMAGDNGIVEVWRTHDLNLLYTYPTCDTRIHSLALAHDQRYLLAGLGTGCIIVFNIDFNKWHHEFQDKYRGAQ
ncbi:unnamed protein product [Owenia fusiformis]|uniref:Neurobeachin n=1 Tax=Owenia fusiformis TaxID=6347 RepID=A0A8S4N8R8_OWEFU|nr:unnamed protein product [Owenia fusiformis]